MRTDTVTAAPAGTVIVLRDDGRVLMMRRNPTQSFLAGFWVFPGGTVDAAEASRFVDPIAAAAVAAARELREETRLTVDAGALRRFAYWITPSARARRFDTHFFVTAAPPDQEPVAVEAEASELRWVSASTWQAADEADFALPPPTRIVLREIEEALAAHGGVETLLENSASRRILPVMPKMLDKTTVLMPWDPDYPAADGLGIAWSASDVAARRDWPSRLRFG